MSEDISHFVSLFENATEGFIVTGPDGTIMLANPSAYRMFGYGEDELLGQQIEILIPMKYREGHEKLRQGFYEQPKNRVMGHGRDLYAQRKDHTSFPVEVSLSTYMREGQRYVIAFLVDITHRKKMEEDLVHQKQELEKVSSELRSLNTELELKVEERTAILKEALQRLEQSQTEVSEALDKERQLNEIKSRFVSMASHEFRTPLSTVLSSASLISKYVKDEEQEKRQKHIDKIKGSVKHLNDLLEDFLSLGRLDEGKVAFTPARFVIEELIRDTIDDMRGLVKPQQQIIFEGKGRTMIDTDKKMLKNVLINLISNAIKFSEKDIVVRLNANHTIATIDVTDKGIGISDEDKEHLFSSFFRGANAQNIQGTGLGLHIVKRYADLLHGTVEMESKLGVGTTVSLTLPLN